MENKSHEICLRTDILFYLLSLLCLPYSMSNVNNFLKIPNVFFFIESNKLQKATFPPLNYITNVFLSGINYILPVSEIIIENHKAISKEHIR